MAEGWHRVLRPLVTSDENLGQCECERALLKKKISHRSFASKQCIRVLHSVWFVVVIDTLELHSVFLL